VAGKEECGMNADLCASVHHVNAVCNKGIVIDAGRNAVATEMTGINTFFSAGTRCSEARIGAERGEAAADP
jgi:hypothetical protein